MELGAQAEQDGEEGYSAQWCHRKNRTAAGKMNQGWRDCPNSLAHVNFQESLTL